MINRLILGAVIAAWGCASSPEDPNLAPVPVYRESEAPCEYEVIDRVRVRQPSRAPTFEEFVRRLRVDLGRAGARVGADAVIAALPDPSNPGTARRREVSGAPPPPPMFTGEAVRFIPDTCGRQGAALDRPPPTPWPETRPPIDPSLVEYLEEAWGIA